MKTQKIIAIIIGTLILISLAVVLYSLSRSSKTTSPTTSPTTQYVVSVIAKNQAADFYLVNGGSQTKIDQVALLRYVEYSFNSPKDIIWVGCIGGYQLSSSTSSTNSKIVSNGAGSVGIEILEDKESNLTITCTKQ